MSPLAQIIGAGVLERYPKLEIQVAEVCVVWVPFWLQEFNLHAVTRAPLPRAASECYKRQIASAFISDGVGGYLLDDYDEFNAMWSRDYPHPASIWPESQQVIEGTLVIYPRRTRQLFFSALSPEARTTAIFPARLSLPRLS